MRTLFLSFILLALMGCQQNENVTKVIDWQGHRGARGLLPENAIPGFLKALEFDITTLELDCVISKDSQVIVSHEPWMSASLCAFPDGEPVEEAQEDSLVIFQMTADEVRRFDCGSRGNNSFENQQPMMVYKPLLSEVFNAVKAYCDTLGRAIPFFNIEIKSNPEWDNVKTPAPRTFAQLLLAVIDNHDLASKTCIQSFDIRALQQVHDLAPEMTTAYLIANTRTVSENLKLLGYTPEIYSPNFRLVTPKMLEEAHGAGMKVIPWTVNDPAAMHSLIVMGVDGIITDYPNLIEEVNEK